jgi:ABC-type polysaccharide/polyol phosphate export permease
MSMLQALWDYRSFVRSSVLREFNARYRESLRGAFWHAAHPLAMIVTYTLIFGQLMRPSLAGQENTPFAFGICLCAGAVTWGLSAEMSALRNFGIVLALHLLLLVPKQWLRVSNSQTSSLPRLQR